ncbi:spore coat protein CotH [Mycobacterium sp. E802]|uniref:CotH kinase family protein n=1 Tax=Mycobacterium sp. E802 TaxID=1834152 RepID=UPI00080124E5|nr:CotH kinase family protein [Mycobacterium sp. E802]OBG80259.1 spore coat protein CotH [Mycobacterium sp. E802]
MTEPNPRDESPPRRRFVHRLPTRLRQHWKLLALLVVATVGLMAAFGQTVIRPYISSDVSVMTSPITNNITGTVDLFDSSVGHTLTINLTDAEYNDMLSAYVKDGAKKWVNADFTIDGTTISDVAVRLKGNSTLMGLRGDGHMAPEMRDGAGPPPDDEFMKTMKYMQASADDPTSLPLLISFNENAEGRGYQGMTELSVRPGTPVLNESLALSLTAATGQPTQRYAYATYTFNGKTTTRLLLEHPDETYGNTLFDSDGYLYKADASSRLEFSGTDQSRYADQFKQINSVDNGNLQPIINFLQWLDRADQEEFDVHLGDWVDVDSLARYLATQNLLANGDDMGGPGQNYYLWYDLGTKKISVISWDLNLAMMGEPDVRPDEKVQMKLPEHPEDGPPGGQGPPGMGPGPGGDGNGPKQMLGGNQLKDRFRDSKAWAQTYDDAYWALYDQMYADGQAHTLLDQIAATIPLTDGLTEQELNEQVDSMRQWIDKRVAALEKARAE